MTGFIAACLLAFAGAAVHAHLQAVPATSFEVASVKRLSGAPRGRVTIQPGGRFMAPSSTVRELIAAAYGVQDVQIVGGPDWIGRDRFEIIASATAGVGLAEARAMLRALLADRFGLVVHTATRELPVYFLLLSRDDRRLGPQLRPSGPDCAPMTGPPKGVPAPPFVAAAPPPPPGEPAPLGLDAAPLRCPSVMASMNGNGHWSVRETTLSRIAERLTIELGRPVIDRTGLEGLYDLDLTFASDAAVLAVQGVTVVPPLPTALREQLGLRLDSGRAPVEVVEIDQVEAPSEN